MSALLSVSSVLCLSVSSVGVDEVPVRSIVERSLPFLERGGVEWIQERSCVSCHHVSFMIWTHNEARRGGVDVDDGKIQDWTNWALVDTLARGNDGGGIDTMSQLLLGRDRGSPWRQKPPRHFKTADPYEAIYRFLLERQNEDGSWPPEGQLRTPPEITTGWALLALESRGDTDTDPGLGLDPDADLGDPLTSQLEFIEEHWPETRERGLEYLREVEPHETNEAFLLRILSRGIHAGEPVAALRAEILARQNDDGGWSNRREHSASDAFATGQALFALSLLEVSGDDPAMAKARRFLAGTQTDDGSWPVNAEQIRQGEGTESVNEIFTYWGTAWAVIGLLRTAPGAS